MRATPSGLAVVAFVVIASLTGCSTDSGGSSGSPPATPQDLPLSASFTAGGEVVRLQVARTPQQQDIGLMFRTALPADRGMAFPAVPARTFTLWMKDMRIPLDMVFVRNGVVTKVTADVPICAANPCPTYSSGEPVDYVIELKAGQAAKLGLEPGTPLAVAEE